MLIFFILRSSHCMGTNKYVLTILSFFVSVMQQLLQAQSINEDLSKQFV